MDFLLGTGTTTLSNSDNFLYCSAKALRVWTYGQTLSWFLPSPSTAAPTLQKPAVGIRGPECRSNYISVEEEDYF